MAKIKVRLDNPVDKAFINENRLEIVGGEGSCLYLLLTLSNNYKGDDERILYEVSHQALNGYKGKYSIVWDESDY